MKPSNRRGVELERGDTLIEILLALFVLGLTALAVIIAFSTSISASQTHREIATANIVLDSVSQQAISQIEQNTSLFGCGYSVQAAAFINQGINFTIPAQVYGGSNAYTAQISNVQYWNGTSFVPNCLPGNVPMDITVEVTANNQSYTNSFVVDLPSGDLGIGPDLSNGVASQLVFGGVAGETASGSSGVAFAPQPVVSVLDSNNEIVQTDLSPINLYIEGSPANVSLSGCSANDPDGVATFAGCTITGPAGTYLVHAVAESLDSDPSGSGLNENPINGLVGNPPFWEVSPTWYGTTFKVTITGAPDKVVFVPAPVAGASGSSLTTQPSIQIQTKAGVVDTTQNGTLTLTLSGGSLTGCLSSTGAVATSNGGELITVPVLAGKVSLTNCQFSGAIFYNATASPPGPDATKYTISASYTNSSSASSTIFVTGPGAASKLVFITQPSGVSSSTNPGATWTSPFSVEIEDASNNPVWTDSGTGVTVKFAASGETLNSGCKATSVTDSAIAVFSTCNGSAYGGGLQLIATYGSITATSAPFSISKNAGSLEFTTQPQAGPSGSALTTQPVIEILDTSMNIDTGWTGSITLTSSGGSLTGCTGLTPNNGIIDVATCLFAGNAGTPYTLTATLATTSISAQSAQFTPSQAGTPTQMQFTTQPVAGAVAGSMLTTQPVIKIEDSQGNVVTTSTATISKLYASTGATLTGCTSLTAVAGVVNISGCSFGGQIGSTYTLTATSLGLTSATSQPFAGNTSPGTEAGVQIAASPTSVPVSNLTNVQLNIEIVDSWGNQTVSNGPTNLTVSSSSTEGFFNVAEGITGTIGNSSTLVISSGASAGTLYYGDEAAGVPTITAYNNSTAQLFASTTLTVNPDAGTQLIYEEAPPGSTAAGSGFGVIVLEQDQYGNTVTTDNSTTVSLGASNGAGSGGFACSTPTSVVNGGVAIFQSCSFVSASSNPYTVTASANGLTSATTSTTVGAGAASRMVIWAGNNQSAKVSSAFAVPLSVLVTDSSGNPIAGQSVTFTSPVGNKSGTVLATAGACVATGGTAAHVCTATTNAAGIASSGTLTAGTTTGSYAVTATSTGLATLTFNETNTSGNTLAFLTGAQTITTVVGSPGTNSGSIVIQTQDGNGNSVVQSAPLVVTLMIAPSAGVTLSNPPGTVTIPAGSSTGVFTFVASTTSAGGTVAINASVAAGYTNASQSETVRANAAANVTTVTPTSPQSVSPGGSVNYPVVIKNSTGTNLYYKVIAVNGLYSTQGISACAGPIRNAATTTINEAISPTASQDSGSYTLDFIVESYTANNCGNGGTTAFYQGNGTLTVKAGSAATLAINGGYGQSTTAGTAFNTPLSAIVTDANGNPVAGVVVTFTSPTGIAGGTFLASANGGTCVASGTPGAITVNSCTATTNVNGIASSATFTADAVTGSYVVSATAPGALMGSPLAYEEENQ